MAPQRSSRFYLRTIVFQVEDTLFRVPSDYFHRHSSVFGAASDISNSNEDLKAEGSSDENPVSLPLPNNTTKHDFEQFLGVVLPLSLSCPVPNNLSRDAWISALKLATFWQFLDIRELAIRELSKTKFNLSATEKVSCGREFRVQQWLREGLQNLAEQDNLPAFEELKTLGMETTAKLLYIRNKCSKGSEQRHSCSNCGYAESLPAHTPVGNRDTLIEEMFGNEILGML